AILRRSRPEPVELQETSFGDVSVNFKTQTATKGKKALRLTAKEFGLLKLLVSREGEVINRNTILNEVWGYEKYPTTRTVDTFIHNLRHKVEKDPARPRHLLTVPWSGYKFQR
ncbi:MAG TPA: DNA-binding response regulator, partial [Candidatus Aminicenantes bacterium]|nr:DNA-binding response regulator [Candidatus Aminicenantes bacterium]